MYLKSRLIDCYYRESKAHKRYGGVYNYQWIHEHRVDIDEAVEYIFTTIYLLNWCAIWGIIFILFLLHAIK